MLCLIFYVPSDKFQSALYHDAKFNIHYAMLVLLCVYILKCFVQYRYFRYAMFNNICAMMRLLHRPIAAYKVQCSMTMYLLLLCYVK